MTPDAQNQKRRIFLVDDHPLVREWLTNLINQQPDMAVCGDAATASEAMLKLPTAQAQVAVIDISLKDSSGIELITQLRKPCPELLILVFSMHDESLYAERALRAGAKGYIMKREATRKVVDAIRHVLDGKFYVSEVIAQVITTQFVQGKTLATHSPVDQLTDRELAVFDMLGQGLATRQIADRLGVSIKTVQAHCARIKEKLNLSSASELVRDAIRYHESQVEHPR